jgi:glycosyltransferase involved in cell wall biosynthesis
MSALHSLYISYFGLREPLVQTQVLPYLRELIKDNVQVTLLTFEPEYKSSWDKPAIAIEKKRLADEGILWECLPYHKRPSLPATVYDIFRGALFVTRINRFRPIDVLHARSHVGAAIAALAKKRIRSRMIFDIRGFMPEEYTDAGRWPEGGLVYRIAKTTEKWLMSSSDAYVVLTEKARTILFGEKCETDRSGKPVEVIPCCVDFKRFSNQENFDRDQIREELGLKGRKVYIYVGALGGWYQTREMADFLSIAKDKDSSTFTIVLTQTRPEDFRELLRERGYPESDYIIKTVSPAEVPRFMKAADVAFSFIRPCFSKLSSSPTKIAEYLAGGLPVISTSGIGDLDSQLQEDRVGVLIKEHSKDSYLQAIEKIDELLTDKETPSRCIESAKKRFCLEKVGGVLYRRLYSRLGVRQKGVDLSFISGNTEHAS